MNTTIQLSLIIAFVLFPTIIRGSQVIYVQPEQIHLSLGVKSNQIVVTWTTFNSTIRSTVCYGIESMDQVAHGSQNEFIDDGTERRKLFIHRVYLNDLNANTTYKYHVGSTQGWSEIFTFHTFPMGHEWSPRFVIYGDLGNVNGRTLSRLQDEIQSGNHDLVLHLGDFAYDLHDDNGRMGDQFMRQIEPIAAYVPYQVLPGNHDNAYNFSHYNNRFTMHSEGDNVTNNHFWSYNIGPVHLIAFSTEFLYYTKYGKQQIRNQFDWLEHDLIEANRPENRAIRPWIVTAGHRAIYTQRYVNTVVKNGNEFGPGFEELFFKYGVDLELWGHEHIYERIWPIYNGTVFNGTNDNAYYNPRAPVHVTTGSAGCILLPPKILQRRPEFSAFASNDYTFTQMHVINGTHIQLQQVSDNQNGQIIDQIYLIKDNHGTYEFK